jgi:diguanylate cyclase (GGDEF)-like protein
MTVVMLGFSMTRISFVVGLLTGCASVLFYGLRVAFIQARQMDMLRAGDLSSLRLEQQVGRDALTGIANRVTLDTRLREAMEEGQRTSHYCAVLMIDIDFFKQYNDSLGHIAGDACLVKVASVLSSQLRARDSVARYGGEEFVVVLMDANAEAAVEAAKRMTGAIERLNIPHPLSPYERITVSIGIAMQAADTPMDPVFLLEESDRALYMAKKNGRDRVEVADESAHDLTAGWNKFDVRGNTII